MIPNCGRAAVLNPDLLDCKVQVITYSVISVQAEPVIIWRSCWLLHPLISPQSFVTTVRVLNDQPFCLSEVCAARWVVWIISLVRGIRPKLLTISHISHRESIASREQDHHEIICQMLQTKGYVQTRAKSRVGNFRSATSSPCLGVQFAVQSSHARQCKYARR